MRCCKLLKDNLLRSLTLWKHRGGELGLGSRGGMGWAAGRAPWEGWVVQSVAHRCDCRSVCFHSTCFSWLLSIGEGYWGMPSHADKNSPQGLLGSGVFSPELLLNCCSSLPFFPFCPLLSVGSVPSLRSSAGGIRPAGPLICTSSRTLMGWRGGGAQHRSHSVMLG